MERSKTTFLFVIRTLEGAQEAGYGDLRGLLRVTREATKDPVLLVHGAWWRTKEESITSHVKNQRSDHKELLKV